MNNPLVTRSAWQFGLATIFVTAALFYFGHGLNPVWPLTWIAPVPALVFAPRVRKRSAFLVAFAGMALGSLTWWHYLHTVLDLPLYVFVLSMTVPSTIFGLGVLLARRFLIRESQWRAALALPAVWTSYEYLNALTSPHSTFGSLAYTQMNFLPVLQTASVTGVWGVVFLLFFFASSTAVILIGLPQSRRYRFGVTVLALFGVVFGWGLYRSLRTPQRGERVAIGLIASDTRENDSPLAGEKGHGIWARYLEQIPALASQGAQTVVIPEKIVTADESQIPQMDQEFQDAATTNRINILVGIDLHQRDGYLNQARFYHADGSAVSTYVKHHLVPGFEARDLPGTSFTVMATPAQVSALAICKDMDFPALSRHYGNSEVALLLVPAWDFNIDRLLHGRMAVMRGVEDGFTIARSAKNGLLTISDPRGRILAERSSDAAPFSTLVEVVDVRHVSTLYARFGNWFAWFSVGLLVLLISSAVIGPGEKAARASSAS